MRRSLVHKILGVVLSIGATASLHAITAEEVLAGFAARLAIPELSATIKVRLIARNGDVREIETRAYQKNVDATQNNRLFVFDFPPRCAARRCCCTPISTVATTPCGSTSPRCVESSGSRSKAPAVGISWAATSPIAT